MSFGGGKWHINAVVDSYNEYYGSIDGVPIIRKEDIHKFDYEYIVVAIEDFQAILQIGIELGIDVKKMIPARVFEIPLFDFDDYICLRESKVSILSDYCLGGYIYHRFGLSFSSPTINMYCRNNSYLAFLKDIPRHLSASMKEVKDDYENDIVYPTGLLGEDSVWKFCHHKSFAEGEALWAKRSMRFNLNNFVVVMVLFSDESAEEFSSLPIRHKLGFYYKDLHLPDVVYTPEWQSERVRYRNKFVYSAFCNRIGQDNNGQANINWLKFLLHKDGFIRKL